MQATVILPKEPYLKNNNIKKLTEVLSGYYRLRIGSYRQRRYFRITSNDFSVAAILFTLDLSSFLATYDFYAGSPYRYIGKGYNWTE